MSVRKRGNGKGSITYVPGRPENGWRASVTIGWTPSGKPVRRSRFAASQREAEALLQQMVAGRIPPKRGSRRFLPEESVKSYLPRRDRRDVSPRVRFLVFQRDGFACVYCGARPPEVRLVVDHAVAYSKEGANNIENFRTACYDCNAGKSNLDLSA